MRNLILTLLLLIASPALAQDKPHTVNEMAEACLAAAMTMADDEVPERLRAATSLCLTTIDTLMISERRSGICWKDVEAGDLNSRMMAAAVMKFVWKAPHLLDRDFSAVAKAALQDKFPCAGRAIQGVPYPQGTSVPFGTVQVKE